MAYTDNFVAEFLPLINDLVSAENADFNKAIFRKSFLASDFAKHHTLVTGVRNGSAVPIIDSEPNYSAFPFADPASCEPQECGISTAYSAYKWQLGLISCRVSICLRSFNDNFLKFWNSYKMLNPDKAEDKYIKSAMMQYIAELLTDSLEASKWRVGYFADSDDASPLLNGFDGYFTQGEAVPSLVVPIAKNAGTSYSAQVMTGDEVYALLKDMYDLYEEQEWAHESAVEFRITKKMAMTLASHLNSLADKSCCDGVERLNPATFGGESYTFDNLKFRGIPIVPIKEWDHVINKVFPLNGGGGNAPRVNPNRALLTSKSELLLGTEEKDMLSMLDIFYSKKDKKVYFDLESYLGVAMPKRQFIVGI